MGGTAVSTTGGHQYLPQEMFGPDLVGRVRFVHNRLVIVVRHRFRGGLEPRIWVITSDRKHQSAPGKHGHHVEYSTRHACGAVARGGCYG